MLIEAKQGSRNDEGSETMPWKGLWPKMQIGDVTFQLCPGPPAVVPDLSDRDLAPKVLRNYDCKHVDGT